MAYDIVTDSSANLTEEMYDQFGISVLPLRFMNDGQEFVSYQKGVTTDLKLFYDRMREGAVYTTSLPYPHETEVTLRGILEEGRDILYIGFSSGLSGTYDGTRIIMEELAKEYPDRKLMHVDTLAAAAGQGLLVWYAAKMKEGGASMEEVHAWVTENRLKLAHWFTVDDLVYLFRGGRVSRTSAWAGTLLKIKPVLHVDDEGKLIPMQKVRGRKKSIDALFEQIKKSADQPVSDQAVFISHGDCLEDVEYLEKRIEEEWHPKMIFHNILDPVIGAHSGPGTLALFFLASSRG
ncbi:MAG: DegV family protein [Coriobacteriaceae bacterium]|nr:DegV family protein [Coriobacteriaceae bacterium]